MTEIERWRDPKDTLGQPDVLNTAHKLATQIAGTDFAPKSLRGRPEAVMAALLMGREIGLGPMSALAHIHIIEGRPSIDALTLRGLVLSAGHEMWVQESTPQSATVCGRRRGSEHVQTVTWTMKDAQNAGLASKDNWRKYPRQMLVSRASAEVARLVAPDALGGVAYTDDEIRDGATAQADLGPSDADAPTAQKRTVSRRQAPPAPLADIAPAAPAAPAESFDDEPVEAEIVDHPRGKLTDAQRFAMSLGVDDATRHRLYQLAVGDWDNDVRYDGLFPAARNQVARWANAITTNRTTLADLETEIIGVEQEQPT